MEHSMQTRSPRLFTRNFSLLILGQALSLLGNYTLKFALSMYILEETGSAAVFASLLAVAMVPTILLSPFGGMMADRLNRRNMMVALDLLSGIAVLLAFLAFRQTAGIPLVGALQVVLAVLGAFESPTVQACVPQMLSGDNLLRGNAAVSQVQALAGMITPFTGSVFYAAFGIRPVLAAVAACFGLTALLECFIRLEHRRLPQTGSVLQMVREDFRDSFRFLWIDQPQVLKLLLLAAAVSFFVIGTAVVGFPFLVRTVLGLSAEHYGAAESAMGAAAILGAVLVGVFAEKLRPTRLHWLMTALGLCLLPAGLVFLVPMGSFGRYLVLIAAFGAGQILCGMFSVTALSTIQARTPQALTGKVMALVMTISMCAQPLGQLVYGLWFDACASRVWLVLLPTGVVICLIGRWSVGFFSRLAEEPGHHV